MQQGTDYAGWGSIFADVINTATKGSVDDDIKKAAQKLNLNSGFAEGLFNNDPSQTYGNMYDNSQGTPSGGSPPSNTAQFGNQLLGWFSQPTNLFLAVLAFIGTVVFVKNQ